MKNLIFLLLLLCSTVNASNWTPLPLKPLGQTGDCGEGFQKPFYCAFAPSNGNIVYRVNDTSGVWKSTDAGASWVPSNQGFGFMGGSSIGIHPTDPNIVLVAGSHMVSRTSITALYESGISRTIDGGANWVTGTSTVAGAVGDFGQTMFAREAHATQDLFAWVGGGTSMVYCGTVKQGLLRSVDLGATWKVVVPYSITGQIYDIDLRGTGTNANKIIVASANGLTQYTDDGSAPNGYTPAATSGITGARIIEVDQNDTDIMYAATYTQLYKSTTGLSGFSTSGVDNAHWSGLPSGFYIDSMRMCDANTNKVYIHFWKLNTVPAYFYYSLDAGVTFNTPADGSWDSDPDHIVAKFNRGYQNYEGSPGRTVIACHPTDSTVVIVNNGLEQTLKSTDSGASFAYSNTGYTGYASGEATNEKSYLGFIVGSTTVMRAGADFGMWMTYDSSGVTRNVVSPTGGRNDYDAVAIEPDTATPVIIAAYSQDAEKVIITPGGVTYTCIKYHTASASNKPPNTTYWTQTGSGGSTWVSGEIYTTIEDSYIFTSPAGSFGNSWTKKTPTFSHSGHGCRLIKFNENDPNYVYAYGYKSSDKGSTWSTIASAVLDVYQGNNDILYSITGSSVCYILKSTNGRAATPTFSSASPNFVLTGGWQTGEGFCSSPNNPDKWYVPAGNDGVWVVTGTSTALKNISHGLTTDGSSKWNYRMCVADPNNPNTVYALAQCHPNFRGGGIFRTVDGGLSWTNITSGTELGNSNPEVMSVDPNTSYLYVTGFYGTWVYNADAPLVDITVPTTLGYFGTSSATLTISGSASDTDLVSSVTYALTGDTTSSGTAVGTETWSISALPFNTGTTTVTITATDTTGNSATDVLVVGRAGTPPANEDPDMIFPHTSQIITIDGTATESSWENPTAHDINLVISGVQVGTVTASVKGMWDENYIYVAISGTDSAKNNDTGTATPHLDTACEVYFDMRRNKGAYGADDFHFILPWNTGNFIWEVGSKTSGVVSSMSTHAAGYTLEMAIPWSLLTIQGTNSTTFGADFQIDIDNDGGNTRECAKGTFNSLDTNYYTMDDLGLIILGTVTTSGGGGGGAGSSTVTKITDYIAEWKFDEASGSSTVDSQGQNHGTHSGTGGRTISAGRYGNAVTVTGSSSFNCGSPSALDNVGTRTIVMQHKPTSDSGSICGKSTSPNSYWEFSATKAYWFNMDFAITDLSVLSANDSMTLNEWQTAAVTWDGGSTTANVKHYVNGNLVSQGGTVAGVGAYSNDAAKDWFLLNRNTGSNPLAAAVDNLSMFSRILTAQELLDCAAWVQGTTSAALDITSLTASLYGSVSISFGTTAVTACFDYGTETGSYLAGSTTAQNTGRTTVGVSDVIHTISGLTPGTTYYYRLRVESPAYTVYGAESSFVTLSADATVPTIGINYPTSAANYQTSSSLPLLVTGTSSDNVSVSSVVWINQATGATGTCVGTTQWNVQEFPIQEGTNTCKFTAFDASNNQATATVNIYRNLDTPVTEITSPSANCTFSDGNPAYGTTGTNITLTGAAVDNYNGITQVTISNNNTSTVNTATGTSSWSYTQRILAQLDDGLVFRAALDEPNGVTQIKDSSRYASHGTNTGAVGTDTSKFGRSRYFDGEDDYVNFGDPSDGHLDLGTSTITLWIKVPSDLSSSYLGVLGKWTSVSGYDFGLEGGKTRFSLRDAAGGILSYQIGQDLRNNLFSHIVFMSTTSSIRTFINGAQVGTETGNWIPTANSSNFYIGNRDTAFPAFKGYLDEVRMYNRALSQAEITQLYELTSPDQDNIIRATGHDVILNQGTDTIHIGAFPTTTTSDATDVNYHSAQLNGTVNPNNNTATVWFDYGLSSGEYTGSSSTQVVTGDTDTAIGIALGALNKGTEYFCRLVGSGTVGLTYGNEYSFTTLAGYTLEEVTGISSPLSWSLMESTKFLKGLRDYGIYNWKTVWRSTQDRQDLIDDPDTEITEAIEAQ